MAWSAAKEEELKQARQAAAWRWVAYGLTVVGLAIGLAGPGVMNRLSPGNDGADIVGMITVAWFIAGLILLLAIILDVPAEKAAKRAKVLKAEKQDTTPA